MGNVHMEATQINYRGGSKKMSVEEAIKAAGTEITPEEKTWIDSIPALTTSNAGKTDQTVIAPEFDAESGVYAVGDKVMYEGKLYKFTSAHETPGDWDSTEVSETTLDDEISSLESGLTNVETAINSNMAVIKVNNPTTGENHLSYPTGYNRDNTIIITGIVKLQHESYFNADEFDYIVTRSGGITCKINNANVDYTFYVVVAKKDIPA